MAKSYDKLERGAYLALLAARIGKERSRITLEARKWGNPADHALFESERIEREEREKRKKK